MADIDILADTPETAPKADVSRSGLRPPRAVEIRKLRSSHAYKSSSEKFRKECQRRQAPCWLCGQPIQYNLRFPHPASFSVDHVIPVNERPELILDTNNWSASHFGCNSARGGMSEDIFGPTALGTPSEEW